jgi:hypothetical protein
VFMFLYDWNTRERVNQHGKIARKISAIRWHHRALVGYEPETNVGMSRIGLRFESNQRPSNRLSNFFAPVAKMNSMHVLLSIATTYDLELQEADVDTAFLYGDMETELYMKQSTVFIEPGKGHLVCKLKKCLYGTKQAARQWYLKKRSCMIKNGYKSCSAGNCIFIKEAYGKVSIIGIYVDDLIIACSSSQEVQSIIAFLKESFSIKELGNLQYCLGVKIDRDRPNGQMLLSQKAYVERLVEKFGLTDCKPCYTPYSMEVLTKPEETWDLQYPYREAIGSLMYLMLCTQT